jgi:hypothetical protein
MAHRTQYGSLATYVAHRAANEEVELRYIMATLAHQAIARGTYTADDLPNGCDLWYDLQSEQELSF